MLFSNMSPHSKKLFKRIGFFCAGMLGFALIVFLTPLRDYIDLEKSQDLLFSLRNTWSLFFILLFVYAVGSWLLIPITLTTIAAIVSFPLWKAIVCAIIGVWLSATFGYIIGRKGLSLSSSEDRAKQIKLVKQEIDRYGFWAVVFLRLSPQPPFVVSSVIAGSLKINYGYYLVATFIGLSPLIILTFIFGKQAQLIIENPSIMAGLTLVSFICIGGILYSVKKRYFNHLKEEKNSLNANSYSL